METEFDIVVIGSGPGGYTAAIRAAQLGYKTAIVEKYSVLGGTCTNVGCIPSKAMLDSTEQYHALLHGATKKGIMIEKAAIDFNSLVARNRNVVKQNTDGLNFLMRKNKITVLNGLASFADSKTIHVNGNGNSQQITSKYFIVATGSKPLSIPGVTIDKTRIITSTEALYLPEKPASMVIIGGGVIGLEMASIYSRIGTEVTILEYADSIVPTMDKELTKELGKILSKKGIKILTSCKVQSCTNNGNSVTVNYKDQQDVPVDLQAEYCLVAVGRRPYTEGLEPQKANISIDKRGFIEVNDQLQTAAQNIFAIGDVVRGAMLAHKAEDEAIAVMDGIHGHPHKINYLRIPGVIYTWPEAASVGYTEEQLKEQQIEYNKGKFPFIASGRARASDDTEGFVKVLSDPKYGEILGVHIIAARAADLIAQAVIAMEFELTDTEISKISYAHPTFSEALREAYLTTSGRGAINL